MHRPEPGVRARATFGWPGKASRVVALFCGLVAGPLYAGTETWRVDNTTRIFGHDVFAIGAPRRHEEAGVTVLDFDGAKDGVLVPVIPFAREREFTIEILFKPAADGPAEQRFFHAQDGAGRRALIETRLDGKGGWWLDTYIETVGRGVTLVDPARVHPAGRWYWAALRYDGKTMAHFVNGRKEREEAASFERFDAGQISLGVRQNRVYWFKGSIQEVRFHVTAVSEDALQRAR